MFYLLSKFSSLLTSVKNPIILYRKVLYCSSVSSLLLSPQLREYIQFNQCDYPHPQNLANVKCQLVAADIFDKINSVFGSSSFHIQSINIVMPHSYLCSLFLFWCCIFPPHKSNFGYKEVVCPNKQAPSDTCTMLTCLCGAHSNYSWWSVKWTRLCSAWYNVKLCYWKKPTH